MLARRSAIALPAARSALVLLASAGIAAGGLCVPTAETLAQRSVAVAQATSAPASIAVSADPRAVPSKVSAQVAASARTDLGALSSFYSFSKLGGVRLVLASSPEQFQRVTGTPPGDVLAVADESSRRIIISPTSWRGDPSRLGGVLTHELSHLVLGAKFRAAGADLPRWLDEGMAQYVAGDWEFDIDWAAQQGQIMEGAAASGRIVPIEQLDSLFSGDRSEVQLAYAQSYSFVSYLASTYGQRNLRIFLDGAARPEATPGQGPARPGVTLDGAARMAFGAGMPQLEAAWRDAIESRSRWWDVFLQESNFSVLLWSTLAALVIIGFVVVSLRKRRAYAGMEEEGETHGRYT